MKAPSALAAADSKVTSTDIRHALIKHFAPPSHRVFFEVSNDTGTRASRWIDAVAIGVWPSTGNEVVGIEIKVSRSDWLRELKAPAKAQELMKFCTRWYLACPAGMVKPDELPATWGMLAYKDGSFRKTVTAKLLEPAPITPGFMSAVIRHASAVDMDLVRRLVEERVAEREKDFDARVEREIRYRAESVSRRTKNVEAIGQVLSTITGEEVSNWTFDAKALGAAYHFLKGSGLHQVERWGSGNLPSILRHLEEAATGLRKIFDDPALQELRAATPSDEQIAAAQKAAA